VESPVKTVGSKVLTVESSITTNKGDEYGKEQ
jgi:hypothetical protein